MPLAFWPLNAELPGYIDDDVVFRTYFGRKSRGACIILILNDSIII